MSDLIPPIRNAFRLRGRVVLRMAIGVVAAVMSQPAVLQGQLASLLFTKPQTSLAVHTVDGAVVRLKTVIVSEPAELRQGLMHVKHLPTNLTMLFMHEPPRRSSMWMKNTNISLDMWWVDTSLAIRHIAYNAKPHSLDSIGYDQPVRAVIEVNAGLSRMLGITEGARIELGDP